MRATYTNDGRVHVVLGEGEKLGVGEGPGEMLVTPLPGIVAWDELVAREIPIEPAESRDDPPAG